MDSNTPFFKYEGTGNDFVLIEDYEREFPINSALITKICDRNLGIGADGILLLQKSKIADVKMRIFNQDGSEATMCGNGTRCVIKHLAKSCSIETGGGISLGESNKLSIRVTLPKSEIIQSPIFLAHNLTGHLVDTGTPHLVIFTDNPDDPVLLSMASKYKTDPMFGDKGVNVNLAKVIPEGIRIRTFEKGVENETKSCGTGGAAVSLIYKKQNNRDVIKILFTTTELLFSIDSKERIWMEGPARLVFQGNLCLKNLS